MTSCPRRWRKSILATKKLQSLVQELKGYSLQNIRVNNDMLTSYDIIILTLFDSLWNWEIPVSQAMQNIFETIKNNFDCF